MYNFDRIKCMIRTYKKEQLKFCFVNLLHFLYGIVYILCFLSFTDPMQWSDIQVEQWLNWAIREFTLEGVNISNFKMRGRELCKMEKEKFLKLAPPFMGDILWEHLDILQKGRFEI